MTPVPDISLVRSPGGARFRSPSGARLIARTRDDGLIAIEDEHPPPGQSGLVGTVRPPAAGDEAPAAWHPQLVGGRELGTRGCWQAAARSVAVHATGYQELSKPGAGIPGV